MNLMLFEVLLVMIALPTFLSSEIQQLWAQCIKYLYVVECDDKKNRKHVCFTRRKTSFATTFKIVTNLGFEGTANNEHAFFLILPDQGTNFFGELAHALRVCITIITMMMMAVILVVVILVVVMVESRKVIDAHLEVWVFREMRVHNRVLQLQSKEMAMCEMLNLHSSNCIKASVENDVNIKHTCTHLFLSISQSMIWSDTVIGSGE